MAQIVGIPATLPLKPAEILKACVEISKQFRTMHQHCQQRLEDYQRADAVPLAFAPGR